MELNLTDQSVLFIDTAPLIYFFEDHRLFAPLVDAIFQSAIQSKARMVTSMVTYIEVLTLPQRAGDRRLVSRYRQYLTRSRHFNIYPLNVSVADAAILFRVQYNLKTPDAIQLATAKVAGADYVLTNDRHWGRISELQVLQLCDMVDPVAEE